MTLEELEEHLKETATWHASSPERREAFAVEMKDVRYGYGPTLQAWHFFRAGFIAGMRNAGYS